MNRLDFCSINHYLIVEYQLIGRIFRRDLITAANGDEIHTMVTEAGIAEDNDLYQLYYIYTIMGGTGRFEYIVPWEWEMIIYGNMDIAGLTWSV